MAHFKDLQSTWKRAMGRSPATPRPVVSGSDDTTVKVRDLELGTLLATLEGHGDGVRAVAVTPDGRRAVSGSIDRTVRLWDPATGKQLAVFTADGRLTCCAVTPARHLAVAGDSLGQVHMLEILL